VTLWTGGILLSFSVDQLALVVLLEEFQALFSVMDLSPPSPHVLEILGYVFVELHHHYHRHHQVMLLAEVMLLFVSVDLLLLGLNSPD